MQRWPEETLHTFRCRMGSLVPGRWRCGFSERAGSAGWQDRATRTLGLPRDLASALNTLSALVSPFGGAGFLVLSWEAWVLPVLHPGWWAWGGPAAPYPLFTLRDAQGPAGKGKVTHTGPRVPMAGTTAGPRVWTCPSSPLSSHGASAVSPETEPGTYRPGILQSSHAQTRMAMRGDGGGTRNVLDCSRLCP